MHQNMQDKYHTRTYSHEQMYSQSYCKVAENIDHTQYSHSIICANTSEGRKMFSPVSTSSPSSLLFLSGPSADRVWVDNTSPCCNEEGLVEDMVP